MRFSSIAGAALLSAGLLFSCSEQRNDATVRQIADVNHVTGIAADGNTVYCATQGGLVVWDLSSRQYTILSTANGLPSNDLRDVVIDGGGALWVATKLGVALREGSGWKVFDSSDGLPADEVTDLSVDIEGAAWASTTGGVVSLKGGKPGFLDDSSGPGSRAINVVYFDSGKNMWVGTTENGIYVNLQGNWRNLTTRNGLLLNKANTVAQNWDNSIWVGSSVGVNRWDGAGFQTVGVKKHMGTFDVRKIIPTRERLWFFSATGVHVMKGSTWDHYTEREGLVSDAVNTGLVISDERVFAGTINGMSLIENGTVINYVVPNTPFGKDFITLAVDRNNRLYAGTRESGLNVLDSGYWALLPGQNANSLETVQSIVFAPDGATVFNTSSGVAFLRGLDWKTATRSNGIAGDDVRCGVYDRQGRYWVGTSTGVSCLTGSAWSRYRGVHGLPSEDIRACALDSTGTVWFGTAAGIVSFADNRLNNWSASAGAENTEILSVAVSGNRVYFGTGDGKLIEYDGSSWKSSGKAASGITAILPDSSGGLWLGTDNDGVLRVGGAKYTMADGLPSNRVRALAFHDGKLVAGCYGGIGIIDLDAGE